MKTTLIRPAQASDAVHILALINELAAFERAPDEVEVTVPELIQDGFGEHPKFKCFVAEVKEQIVGMALFYPSYSTWKGKSWHLEDLIVTESMRGQGIGFALLKEFILFAQASGVRRIQWVVLNWNTPAIDFYQKHGATILEEWNITLMSKGAMNHFIAEHHAGI